MRFRDIALLIIAVFVCSCIQQSSKNSVQIDSGPNQHYELKNGIKIENNVNRGVSYTDSLGSKYNLRYIPISITNGNISPIQLYIAFSKEYNFPHPNTHQIFKLIPLPKEWALDGVGITDSMVNEIPTLIDNPNVNITIEPGEKFIIAIGTLYPSPPKTGGVLPKMLFAHNYPGDFPSCDWVMEEDLSLHPEIALGLKLNFGQNCIVIPCGMISFHER
ncbi:MAG: hypothetical protein R3250_17595 [Melioribacteraceae bacterium]|nr:hypothetical protein [Melioribacteraceae bacterium]